jgi:hypothetical protein
LFKLKGLLEEAILEMNFEKTCIYRPGFLLNRDGDKRLIERIAGIVPFIPKIETKHLGRVMIDHGIRVNAMDGNQKIILENTK